MGTLKAIEVFVDRTGFLEGPSDEKDVDVYASFFAYGELLQKRLAVAYSPVPVTVTLLSCAVIDYIQRIQTDNQSRQNSVVIDYEGDDEPGDAARESRIVEDIRQAVGNVYEDFDAWLVYQQKVQ